LNLTKLSDYAVVILAAMAKNSALEADKESAPLQSASSLAHLTLLPEPTVSKILKLLAKWRLIESVRGVNGGYRLNTPADQVTMIDVIEAVEGPVSLVSCLEQGHDECPIQHACSMSGAWAPVNTAIRTALENVSLQDMMVYRNHTGTTTILKQKAIH